jgi:nicotinate-nucleotide adenylyltransferase
MAGLTREKIGIFGGSFDPPHLGHLVLADEARFQMGLDSVLWVLTPDNPLKPGEPTTPLQDRIDLLGVAIAHQPTFEISRVDLDRPPPYYSFETVKRIASQIPGAGLVFLMGGDSLNDLPRWKQPLELLAGIQELGVMHRPGVSFDLDVLETQIPGLSAKVRFIDVPLLEISARDIRSRIASGAPFRYFLPEAVYQVITERGLYGFKR